MRLASLRFAPRRSAPGPIRKPLTTRQSVGSAAGVPNVPTPDDTPNSVALPRSVAKMLVPDRTARVRLLLVKLAFARFARLRSAPVRLLLLKSAFVRFAKLRSAPVRSAPAAFARDRLTFVNVALVNTAAVRSRPDKFSPVRFAPVRLAPERLAPSNLTPPVRFAPERFAPFREAPERSAPARLRPLRSRPLRSAPARFAPGPTRYPDGSPVHRQPAGSLQPVQSTPPETTAVRVALLRSAGGTGRSASGSPARFASVSCAPGPTR